MIQCLQIGGAAGQIRRARYGERCAKKPVGGISFGTGRAVRSTHQLPCVIITQYRLIDPLAPYAILLYDEHPTNAPHSRTLWWTMACSKVVNRLYLVTPFTTNNNNNLAISIDFLFDF